MKTKTEKIFHVISVLIIIVSLCLFFYTLGNNKGWRKGVSDLSDYIIENFECGKNICVNPLCENLIMYYDFDKLECQKQKELLEEQINDRLWDRALTEEEIRIIHLDCKLLNKEGRRRDG